VTTTPKPVKHLKDLLKKPNTVVTTATTYDNRANLADAFFARIIRRYEGTRIGQQELYAKLLEDAPGALWKRDNIEALRVTKTPQLVRVVVAVDPAVTATEDSNEIGIIVAGLGIDGHGYVIDDRSLSASPDAWAKEAVTAYNANRADRIIGEVNNGGDLVEAVIRIQDRNVAYEAVHASRGKQTRAEPVAALYEQGRMHHLGLFADLEDQLCQWVPGDSSPDRLDALVWAFTELMLDEHGVDTMESIYQ
jgi:phage terminase large subunit-like protein